MQTILGATGQIADELAKELHRHYTKEIRLVSRNPRKVNDTDQLFPADLLNAEATQRAVAGSKIAYLTVGLPMDTQRWATQFPLMMRNVIQACERHQCKLVFFDNTYMYAKTRQVQTEESPFVARGPKSRIRAQITNMLLDAMADRKVEAVICRAPEFYGPDKTKGITQSMVFNNIRKNRQLRVPITDDTLRTLIWTPDASRATALIGNTPDAYQQTWHLPCDDNRLTYREMIELTSEICGKRLDYAVIPTWKFQWRSLSRKPVRELLELLPRYKYDNIFISNKFKKRFPEFQWMTYQEGIRLLVRAMGA